MMVRRCWRLESSISGGGSNNAAGRFDSISGGGTNSADGSASSILGGDGISLSGNYGTYPAGP